MPLFPNANPTLPASLTSAVQQGVISSVDTNANLQALLDGIYAVQGQLGSSAEPGWCYWELFTLVAGQADYTWGTGVQNAGSLANGVDTNAYTALVQWGVTILVPNVDYVVLSDRLVLVSTPDAEQAASGAPLSVRVRRSA